MSNWDTRFENNPGRTGLQVYIGVIVVVLLTVWIIAAVTLGLRTATAGIVGKAETHIQNQSSNNRVIQQAGFEQTYADVVKYKQQIKDANKAVEDWDKANAGKQDTVIGTLATQRQYLVSVATGLKQQCQTAVANYNADTHKTLSKDWKRSDLPYELVDTEAC